MEGLKQQQVSVGWDTGLLGCALGSAFLGESLGWLQRWRGPAAVERRQFSSSKTQRLGREGRVPGGAECPREGCAKKMWLAAEQLASAANSDCLAQEDPNYSTTAVAIIAAAGAARAIRHWKGPGCGSRLLELLRSVLAAESRKTYQMSGRKKWVIIRIGLCKCHWPLMWTTWLQSQSGLYTTEGVHGESIGNAATLLGHGSLTCKAVATCVAGVWCE